MTDISSSRVNWLGKFFPRDYPVQNISPANKMKIYLSVVGKSLKDSEEKLNSFKNSVMNRINNILA